MQDLGSPTLPSLKLDWKQRFREEYRKVEYSGFECIRSKISSFMAFLLR